MKPYGFVIEMQPPAYRDGNGGGSWVRAGFGIDDESRKVALFNEDGEPSTTLFRTAVAARNAIARDLRRPYMADMGWEQHHYRIIPLFSA